MTSTTPPDADPKAMARRLRGALADRGVTVGHGDALELVARQLGVRDWNTLAAGRTATPAQDGHVVPILRVFDESAALAFYVDYLGFRVDWRNETDGHEPLYAQLSRGDARVHLSGHHGDASPGSGVLVPVPDALDAAAVARGQGVCVREPRCRGPPVGSGRDRDRPVQQPDRLRSSRTGYRRRRRHEAEPRSAEAAAPIVLHLWVACSPTAGLRGVHRAAG